MAYNWGWMKICFEKEIKDIPTTSGIYKWERFNEDLNKKSVYIGQTKNLRQRYFSYYCTYKFGKRQDSRPITLSLYKHNYKLKWTKNDLWKYEIVELCDENKLDEREKYWIDYWKVQNVEMKNLVWARTDQVVQSNAKRINKVIEKYENKLKTLLKRVNIHIAETNDEICIFPKENKDKKSFNKLSQNAFNELQKWLIDIINKKENK